MHDNLGLALNNFAIMAVKTMRAFYASILREHLFYFFL